MHRRRQRAGRPRRLLRYLPATLYDVGTAVVVGLTFAPQLLSDARAVRSARALRGHDGRGVRGTGTPAVPVLETAFDRSLGLAASMESRGYGRAVRTTPRGRRTASVLAVVGTLGVLAGLYGLLDSSVGGVLGLPLLVIGVVVAGTSLAIGASRDGRSGHRRDPWTWTETLTVVCGAVPAGVLVVASALGWTGIVPLPRAGPPALPVLTVLAVLVAALPAWFTPRPRRASHDRVRPRHGPLRRCRRAEPARRHARDPGGAGPRRRSHRQRSRRCCEASTDWCPTSAAR